MDGQAKIAEILKESFGHSLVRAELRDGEFVVVGFEGRDKSCNAVKDGGVVDVETLPSPEELKGKILLKVCCASRILRGSESLTTHIGEEPLCLREPGDEAEEYFCRYGVFTYKHDNHYAERE